MPRDLFDSSRAPIVASPDSDSISPKDSQESNTIRKTAYNEFTIHRDETRESRALQLHNDRENIKEKNNIHPYVQTLSISNLEDCVALENAIFPEPERCSREKFKYRLTVCPELCLGLFTSQPSIRTTSSSLTHGVAHPPDSAYPSRRSVLVAMIIATKTLSARVTDDSVGLPSDWASNASYKDSTPLGHQEQGQTIAVHTLGVLPEFQGKGFGKILMRAYEQRMEGSGIAERIALLAHDPLVGMYERMGFENLGKSDVTFAGGGWNDLVYDFSQHEPGMQLMSHGLV